MTKPTTESSVDRLTTLSRDIEAKTRFLTDALRSKGLEAPSYQANGLSDFPLTEVEAVKARQELVALTKELHDLVLGPRESLKNMAWEVSDSLSFVTNRLCESLGKDSKGVNCVGYSVNQLHTFAGHMRVQNCRGCTIDGFYLI